MILEEVNKIYLLHCKKHSYKAFSVSKMMLMERAIYSYLMLFKHWQLCKLLMHSSSQMLTQVNTVTVLSKQMFNNLLFAA